MSQEPPDTPDTRPYEWPVEPDLPPQPDDIEEAATLLGIRPPAFPTSYNVGGPYSVRHARERATDFEIYTAASAVRWVVGSSRPADPLRHLVDGVLSEAGLGPFESPRREYGVLFRRRLIPQIYAMCRRLGLGEVRGRCASAADQIERGLVPIPQTVDTLIALLRDVCNRRAPLPFDLDAEPTGRRFLTLGGQRLVFKKGRDETRAFGMSTREGRFLIAVVRGRRTHVADSSVSAHVGAALARFGVALVRSDGDVRTEPALRLVLPLPAR